MIQPYKLVQTEEEYDQIMRRARKKCETQKDMGNPYDFHEAFEEAWHELLKDREEILTKLTRQAQKRGRYDT